MVLLESVIMMMKGFEGTLTESTLIAMDDTIAQETTPASQIQRSIHE
jgi:hypothetical protein